MGHFHHRCAYGARPSLSLDMYLIEIQQFVHLHLNCFMPYLCSYAPSNIHVLNKTCVCETQMPPAALKSKYGKNLKVLHFDLAPPTGALDVSQV